MKENLDERQVYNRNKIGSQCFTLLSVLLFADIGLSGFGIRWIPYPADIMIILCACLFVFLIRTIISGSYTGPRVNVKKKKGAFWLCVAVAFFGAFLVIFLRDHNVEQTGDNSGMTLFIVTAVMLIILLIVTIIRKKQDSDK